MKKKSLVLIFSFLLFHFFAQASSSSVNPFSFDLGGYFTATVGHQGEYVYEPLSHDRLLSYLEWDEKPVFSVGLIGGIEYNGFQIHVEADISFPGTSGTVTDSDYMNVSEFPNCTDSIAAIKTKYSESLCTSNSLFSIQFQLAYEFNLNQVLSLTPFLGYDYQYSDLSAWGLDGYYYDESYTESNGYFGWYYTSGHNTRVFYSKQTETLNLMRHYHVTWVGLTASFNLSKYFSLDASAGISPFVAVKSLDSHILRKTAFYDDLYSWLRGGKISAALNYKFDQHNCFFGKVEFLSTGIANGITYTVRIGTKSYTAYPNSHAGGDLQIWDFSLGFKHTF